VRPVADQFLNVEVGLHELRRSHDGVQKSLIHFEDLLVLREYLVNLRLKMRISFTTHDFSPLRNYQSRQYVHVNESHQAEPLRDLTHREFIFVGFPEAAAAHVFRVMADAVSLEADMRIAHIVLQLC
jgi:hypothetical protein